MTGILDTILRMSLYGALVGLAALVVSRALNHLRAPKGVALMLWAIARLAAAVSGGSQLQPQCDERSAPAAPDRLQEQLHRQLPDCSSGDAGV